MPNPCEAKRLARNAAQKNLTDKEKILNRKDEIEDDEENTWIALEAVGLVGSAVLALLGEAASGGAATPAILAVAMTGAAGAGGAISQEDDVEEAWNSQAEAYEDYLEAAGALDTAERELEHCGKEKNVEILWDEATVEEDVWEFAEEDLQEEEDEDVMEFTEDDLKEDDLNDDDAEEEEEETWDFLVCEECGFMGETSDFYNKDEAYICPDCKSELDVD